SESRLYTFSPDTLERLENFRLTTSRKTVPQAIIYIIDKKTLEIRPEDIESEFYTTLEALSSDLPDFAPRFILLSYPIKLDPDRESTPYVLIYYMPETNPELKMLYAGAKELFRNTAQVNKVVDVKDRGDIVNVAEVLRKD
ncbi:glia maturation factor beta, partial [Choiromyces venosus 120613-1]